MLTKLKKIIELIRELIRKMRKVLGFACICLILFSVGAFCMNTSIAKVLNGATTDTTATYSVKNTNDLTIIVKHTQTYTAGTQEGTLTMYGTTDDGTTKYLLGVKPLITGTVNGNGAISYGTAQVGTYGYEVVGSHKTLYFNWDDTKVGTGDATVSVWVIGKEY